MKMSPRDVTVWAFKEYVIYCTNSQKVGINQDNDHIIKLNSKKYWLKTLKFTHQGTHFDEKALIYVLNLTALSGARGRKIITVSALIWCWSLSLNIFLPV
jgi:hypothetical protein